MSYSTLNDLLKEFHANEIARISGDPTGNIINIERVNHSIEMADALIDSYIEGRYNLPLESNSIKILNKVSLDLAISNLYEYAFAKTSLPNTIIWRKTNALKILNDIKNGIINLSEFELIKFNTRSRIFNDDFLDDLWI
jgi:phage gp36-like protein